MDHTVRHAAFCDLAHLQWGSPECSRLVREVEGLGVMLVGDGQRVTIALLGAEGKPLSRWPEAIRARVADALLEACELQELYNMLSAAQR